MLKCFFSGGAPKVVGNPRVIRPYRAGNAYFKPWTRNSSAACSKRHDPNNISCDLTGARVKVDVGVDDMGPTWVEVFQRGNTIVAEWTLGGIYDPSSPIKTTKRTDVLLTLPCAVKVRFVR